MVLQCGVKRLQCHWRCHRLITKFVDLALEHKTEAIVTFTFDQMFPHIWLGCFGRLAVKINETVNIFFWHEDLHRAKTGNTAHLWINNCLDKCGCDSRIHYIAASFKDIQTSLYRFWLWCRNHTTRHHTFLHELSTYSITDLNRFLKILPMNSFKLSMVNYCQLMACFCDDRHANVMIEMQDKASKRRNGGQLWIWRS